MKLFNFQYSQKPAVYSFTLILSRVGLYATRIYVDSLDLRREFIGTLAGITHNKNNTQFRV
jgi:hypothetical protein